jgi:hypothetical protein
MKANHFIFEKWIDEERCQPNRDTGIPVGALCQCTMAEYKGKARGEVDDGRGDDDWLRRARNSSVPSSYTCLRTLPPRTHRNAQDYKKKIYLQWVNWKAEVVPKAKVS